MRYAFLLLDVSEESHSQIVPVPLAVPWHSNQIESCRGGCTARLERADTNQLKRVPDVPTLRF